MARPRKLEQDAATVTEERPAQEPKPESVATPESAPQDPELPSIIAGMSAFYHKYQKIGNMLDSFMLDFKRYKFDLTQLENERLAVQRRIKEAEIKLGRIEKEAQTRLQSVEMGHRKLVEKLTAEKIELQRKAAEYEKKSAEAERLKFELEARIAAVNRQAAGLSEIGQKVGK